MKIVVKAAFVAACLVGTAAGAKPADSEWFQSCDGYGPPKGRSDGMVKDTYGLFAATMNTRRTTPLLTGDGIKACDLALADPQLLPEQWRRRVSLIRARAIHDLAAGKDADALADLDKAEAAAQDLADPFYKRSLGLGIQLVRAYALAQTGRKAESDKLLAEVVRARPFNRQILLAAMAVAVDPRSPVAGTPVGELFGRLDPRAIDLMYLAEFDARDFAQAIALQPHLAPPLRPLDKGVQTFSTRIQDVKNAAAEYNYTADRKARLAYVLATMGRADEARREIGAAKTYFAAKMPAAFPPLADGEKPSKSAMEDRALNGIAVDAMQPMQAVLDGWQKLIDWRLELEEPGGPQKVVAGLTPLSLPMTGAQLDFLMTLRRHLGEDRGLDQAIANAQARLAPRRDRSAEVRLLFDALPHTEVHQRIPAYRKANSPFLVALWGGVNGFSSHDEPSGEITVSFVSEQSSATVVEEMALLRAADLARERGKSGIVIKGRSDYQRTQNTYLYSRLIRTEPKGYSTDLRVELVDAANPPAAYHAVPWRVIPVQEILNSLGETYVSPAQGKEPGS